MALKDYVPTLIWLLLALMMLGIFIWGVWNGVSYGFNASKVIVIIATGLISIAIGVLSWREYKEVSQPSTFPVLGPLAP